MTPPPGFEPATEQSIPSAATSNSQIFTGIGSTPPLGRSAADTTTTQTFDSTKSSVENIYPNPERAFRAPSSRILIAEEEPAMPRLWFRLESLYWWTQGSPVSVPLVTKADPSDPIPGAIGQPGTTVLLGDQTMNTSGQDGARFTVGFAFNSAQTWGFEAIFFGLARNSDTSGVYSNGRNGSATLAFPFYDPTSQGEYASPLSSPGQFSGSAWLTTSNRLQGTELNFVNNRYHSDGLRLDLLGGFRYVNFRESLEFDTDSPDVGPPYSYFSTYDYIRANNNFYGAQFGVKGSIDRGRFFANATTKLAIGDMFENVYIDGGTITNIGGYASANGGYFTGPTNMGTHTRSQFAVVPELDLNIGFRLCSWASINVGYTFLYLSAVARPGQQIDHAIDPGNAPAVGGNFTGNSVSSGSPSTGIRTTDFWAQGLNFGLELRF